MIAAVGVFMTIPYKDVKAGETVRQKIKNKNKNKHKFYVGEKFDYDEDRGATETTSCSTSCDSFTCSGTIDYFTHCTVTHDPGDSCNGGAHADPWIGDCEFIGPYNSLVCTCLNQH